MNSLKYMYQILFTILFSLTLFLESCSDDIIIPAEEMGGMPSSESMPPCPEGFLREDGTCWVDPSEYQQATEENGAPLTEDDYLYVDDEILREQESSFLVQEGRGKYYIYVGETKRIGVRSINNIGLPVENTEVSFEIASEGTSNPKGSVLSARIAQSDQFGVAAIEITGGPEPTYFRLDMVADDSTDLSYSINVIQPNISQGVPLENLPSGQRCGPNPAGNYQIINHYELGRFLGSDVFDTLQTINRALSDPGGLIGDWVRDRIGGIIGSAVRGIIQQAVNWILGQFNLPQWAQLVANIVEDVTGILTDLEIEANIRLGGAEEPDCIVPGVHTWEKLVFYWQGGNCGFNADPDCGRETLNLSEVGVSLSESEFQGRLVNPNPLSTQLDIEEHTLQLNIGVVILAIVQNFILPQRANVNSIGDLIAQVMPCDELGNFAAGLVGNIPFVGSAIDGFVEDACQDGLRALGNNLTRQLIDRISVETFKVQGTCKLKDTNGDNNIEEVTDGRWHSEGGDERDYLQGDFEGKKR